ncbi:type VI secretion protein [Pseudoxanthomonas composti]|uniref:Type VI secretion protein n=2 Tax=Pseudoxanthomonas composti TaxID=2137479 RepID=A0A4Q1JZK0_9GAMM|nr:type VI secretion protein [Pseudoxanthomonas composti]
MAQSAANVSKALLKALLLTALVALPAFAGPDDYAGTDGKVCGFLEKFNGLLGMASILVVTIAVIFAGYQIAFAHKRIGDVAPILIGGLLIGAAGQIAAMIIGGDENSDSCTAMVSAMVQYVA